MTERSSRRHGAAARCLAALLLAAVLGSASALAAAAAPRERTLTYNGTARDYLLVQPLATRGRAVPLVIVLHGGGGNADNVLRMTGFAAAAEAQGFLVAAPQGVSRAGPLRTWNAVHCCGYAMSSRSDDIGFLRAVIDSLLAEGLVDRRRIYVTGMSNGAMLALHAGIQLADRVAAVAPVVGGLFGDEPALTAPVSLLAINGAQDRSIPLAGGTTGGRFASAWDGKPLLPVSAQTAHYAQGNGCDGVPQVERNGVLTTTRYRCPTGRAVQAIVIEDGGHAWPGGQRGSRLGDAPSSALDATAAIWAFFAAHPRAE